MARGMRGFRAAGEGCSLLGVTAWPLVGRGDQLERLVQAMTAGGRASLLVAGPAGIGKTRLLAEARGRAEAAGVEVHSALGTGAWAELPFGALAHLLPAGAGPDDLPAMLTATTAMLAGDGTRRVAGHHRQLATQFGTVRVTRCAWRRPGAGNLYRPMPPCRYRRPGTPIPSPAWPHWRPRAARSKPRTRRSPAAAGR
jgi:AAA ATPase domain